jgi:hypothetical protein
MALHYSATPEERAAHYRTELARIDGLLEAIPLNAISECQKLQSRRYGVLLGMFLAEADVREDEALAEFILTGRKIDHVDTQKFY